MKRMQLKYPFSRNAVFGFLSSQSIISQLIRISTLRWFELSGTTSILRKLKETLILSYGGI